MTVSENANINPAAREISRAVAVQASTQHLLHDWVRSPHNLDSRYDLLQHHLLQMEHTDVVSLMQSLKAPPVLESFTRGMEEQQKKQTELDFAVLREMLGTYYVDGNYKKEGREKRVYSADHPPYTPFASLDTALTHTERRVSVWEPTSTKLLGATWIRNAGVLLLEHAGTKSVAMTEVLGQLSENQILALQDAGMRRISMAYLLVGQSSIVFDTIHTQLKDTGILRSGKSPRTIKIPSDQFTLVLDPDDMIAHVDYLDDAQYERIAMHHRAI